MAPFYLVAYILAVSSSGRGGRGRAARRSGGRNSSSAGRVGLGRKRYTRDGTKVKKPSTVEGDNKRYKQDELWPLPPVTMPNEPRPSYFTCRHTYENTLIDEIQRFVQPDDEVVVSSPYPGLVRVEDASDILSEFYDPVYALQSLPQCVVGTAESIKGIARETLSALLGDGSNNEQLDERSEKLRQMLRTAERGSLTIHPLVPGMCKGQSNPIMMNRCTKIGEELSNMLKKIYPAARKAAVDDDGNEMMPSEHWVLQIMLQSPSIAVASLSKCKHVGPGNNAYWTNFHYPMGLAKVDIEERMPSSAYRKLMEGIECMGICPASTSTVVDLGACPGGWTSVMRRHFGCRVVAVDRSNLDPVLMRDEMVTFVRGDAFSFEPPHNMGEDSWMISDVIAYPERTTEMLNTWCENKWASNMIVTMKFQGDEPDLDELCNNAIAVVKGHHCRVKHFFNKKMR